VTRPGPARARRARALVAAVAVAVLASACASERSTSAPSTTKAPSTTAGPATTTTTTPGPPIAPLTGLPDPSGESLKRPALLAKIENTPDARPQSGLNAADVVYEEVVEGGITRFWAVFSTTAPDVIGPIRSVRGIDPAIIWPIGGIAAFSGGTTFNVNAVRAAPVTWIDESNAGDAFFREPTRFAPHNLYGRTQRLWARGGDPVPPRPLFQYLVAGYVSPGDPVSSFRVGFSAGYDPTYTWDAASRTWLRSYGATPFKDVNGQQVAPANVIVQFVPGAADGEGQLVGEGDALLFTDGKVRRGRWIRPDIAQPTRYVDEFGLPMLLTPGKTWVELPPKDYAAVDIR
jgi:hypothetical protein